MQTSDDGSCGIPDEETFGCYWYVWGGYGWTMLKT